MSDQDDSRRADHDSPWKMALESYFEQKSAAFCDSILRMNRQLRQRKASALQV
ncbi:MAG: hypothetical protein XD36_0450 [Halomonas sp. 54_146]|nr:MULTISPECIES: hypothetical protein [unclassified Halomonas]KUJ89235.1 MAG: hypothetical protein XD36_0450 [Halomonas sp. 54_146]